MYSWVKRAANRMESSVSGLLTQPWRAYRRVEEHYLQRLLPDLAVDAVLDVGANVGQYAMMLRDYCGYKGLIVSFEPTPAVFETLSKNSRRDPRWQAIGVALGRSPGHATLRSMPCSSEGNSLLDLRKDYPASVVTVDVEVQTLNALLPDLQRRFGFSRPFLKMDTQGFDLEVFAGASQVSHLIVGIQSELSVDPFYIGAPDWQHALSVYQNAGFKLCTFIANNPGWFPALHEMDCIMYRPEAHRAAQLRSPSV
jgi:FkbM family methyltransferase